MARLQIAKLDAAKRQLETAIRLYFHEADPVSIHTLTAAGYELIKDLNKHWGGDPMWTKEMLPNQWAKPEYRAELLQSLNEAENFFKHADKDHDQLLDFNPRQTELLLLDACEKYHVMTGERSPLFLVYRMWAYLTWAKGMVRDESLLGTIERIKSSQPNQTRPAFFGEWIEIAQDPLIMSRYKESL